MMQSLVNRTPPLVTAWSSPKRLKLTRPEGLALAAKLYKVRGAGGFQGF